MRESLKRPLTFFDLETTSVDCSKARIIEMSFKKIHPSDPSMDESFYSLVNPCEPIPEEATRIHGITNDRVKEEPVFFSLAPSLKTFLNGSDLAGYNILNYDVPVLVEEFLRAGIECPLEQDTSFVDALLIFRKMFPHTLKNAYKYFVGEPWSDDQAHGATYDVERTIDVFSNQLTKYWDEISDKSAAGIQSFTIEKSTLVDYARKLCLNDKGEIVFAFGQHKDKCVSSVPPSYIEWLLKTDFPLHTKFKIKECLGMVLSGK